jgi:glyoxylase-like metal-dependent hydrolase (beta-lactamase superfamily II)
LRSPFRVPKDARIICRVHKRLALLNDFKHIPRYEYDIGTDLMHRRTFLKRAAALPASTLLPCISQASAKLGKATLTTVSDGYLVLPASFIFEPMPTDELGAIVQAYGLNSESLEPECNLALYRDGVNTVLFDVGSGPDFMPSAGRIVESLDALGLAPEDMTHVVFTHAHPDHIWGLLDDFDEPLFANATCMMGRAEWDYWWDPATVDTIGDARAAFAVGAKRRMEAIEDSVVLFDSGDEVLPGIQAIETPGHTPGHMSFEVRQGGDAVLIAGDAIGNHHVAFARPEWPSGSDQDMELAAETRRALFDRITADDLLIAGFHLPDGGLGRVEAKDGNYSFIPEVG